MNFRLKADGLGLVVPINVEAICVGNASPDFRPAPYDFAQLPNGKDSDIPNLSINVFTSDAPTNLTKGVHLHWALPDGITNGRAPQDAGGRVRFPNAPDRWLITRIFSDFSNTGSPVNSVKSWVVESNYVSTELQDRNRPSISVPFKTDDDMGPQYRFMGRVLEYETWRQNCLAKQNNPLLAAEDNDNYVSGLSAVGYGTPEFSASYQNCSSVYGFHDIGSDLEALSTENDDKQLTYHVVGWYDALENDPLNRLPLQLETGSFDKILSNTTEPTDRMALLSAYTVLQPEGPYILISKLSPDAQLNVVRIFLAAGYGFLENLLSQCRWSLPSGTESKATNVTHTLLTGLLTNVTWSTSGDFFTMLDTDINISVGNTSSEALAALIASLSEVADQPNVALLLDALQTGLLKQVTDADSLSRMEKLTMALQQNSFDSHSQGSLWQISLADKSGDNADEVILNNSLADDLNMLNKLQSAYDKVSAEIASLKTQIFMDWYRFMQFLRFDKAPPTNTMTAAKIQPMIEDEIDDLADIDTAHTTDAINNMVALIQSKLPKQYSLSSISSPRYWQPADPVILFQGKDINPPQRYGGDGRFMGDDTLLCRLSAQLVSGLTISPNTIGNDSQLVLNIGNMPKLSAEMPLIYSEQIQALFTEACLLSPLPAAAVCINAGTKADKATITGYLGSNRDGYVTPPIPQQIPAVTVDGMQTTIAPDDFAFFGNLYKQDGDNYVLQIPADNLTKDETLRLEYIFISIAAQWGSNIAVAGIAPSPVYLVTWNNNPWLPFSLSWEAGYYPFRQISPTGNESYPADTITKSFVLGDIDYSYRGLVSVPPNPQTYKNFIFMTPHAELNFQEQIRKFVDSYPGGKLAPELETILEAMKDFPPILSQSLSGMHDAMLMRDLSLQLTIHDPVPGNASLFTNETVKPAVGAMTQTAPSPSCYYNPIRAGVMSIISVTIVDVFGRYIKIPKPDKIIIAQSLQAEGLPANFMFLRPRIVQPSRLQFRWLAADNEAIEMNTHPATTPICGWLLCNHLEASLWVYANDGAPLGSLILSEDSKRVAWQSTPGGPGFNMPIDKYFSTGPGKDANPQLKNLVLALFNQGDGRYLDAFMRANDTAYGLVQPENYKQMGSSAVLMGAPIAVAQARLDLELMGLPAYSQSWADMANVVNNKAQNSDHGFTKVNFPVRLGAMTQVNDGLLGYFKDADYGHYYAMATNQPTKKVTVPDETNIMLTADTAADSQVVTLLLDPRGAVHAVSGVLPVKEISIPPDLYGDAVQALKMAFLTTPILTSIAQLAMPLPAEGGCKWTWLESNGNLWAGSQDIAAVNDRATMSYSPQKIKEGWLVLSNFEKQK